MKTDKKKTRAAYVAPSLERVELAIDETLATGCKTQDDLCEGPPTTLYGYGS